MSLIWCRLSPNLARSEWKNKNARTICFELMFRLLSLKTRDFLFLQKKRICEHHLAPVSMSEWWKSSTEHEQNKNCCVKLELESGDIWQFAFCFSGTWYNDKISKMKCRYIIFTALAKRRRMRRRRMEKKSIKLKILDDGERDWKRCFVYFIHFEHFVRFFKWVFIFFFHFFFQTFKGWARSQS